MTSLSENTVVTTSGGLVELGYRETTFTNTITATTAATAQTLMGAVTVVCDGSPIELEVFLAGARPDTAAGNRQLYLTLLIDGSRVLDQFGLVITPSAGDVFRPTTMRKRLTPTAGVHTYEVRAYVDAGTGFIESGSTPTRNASYIKVNKIIQASQFIVPLASAPLVTSLPSVPIVGQEVRYVADATNGVYWNLHYDGLGTYPWKFIGGRELTSMVLANQGVGLTTNTYIDLGTVGPQITVPLAGDYRIEWGSNASLNAGVSTVAGMGIKFGSASAPANANPETRWVAHIGQPTTSGGAIRAAISNFDIATDVAASTLIKAQYFHNNGNIAAFAYRSLSIVPIRVKAP
jgi:hypothetical protein